MAYVQQTSRTACRRSSSPASARSPTFPRRTTGTAATWPSTSGSPSASAACASPTSPAARATARPCWRARAAEVVGVDANPEAHEHARLRYARPDLRFERALVEDFSRARATRSSSCRRSSTSRTRARCSARIRRGGAGRLRLDPQPADARAGGRREVRQPLAPARVHGSPSTASCSSRTSPRSSSSASSTPQAPRPRARARRSAGTACTRRCGMTKPFYDRFTPAIAASDFAPRRRAEVRPRQGARLPRRLPA